MGLVEGGDGDTFLSDCARIRPVIPAPMMRTCMSLDWGVEVGVGVAMVVVGLCWGFEC